MDQALLDPWELKKRLTKEPTDLFLLQKLSSHSFNSKAASTVYTKPS